MNDTVTVDIPYESLDPLTIGLVRRPELRLPRAALSGDSTTQPVGVA